MLAMNTPERHDSTLHPQSSPRHFLIKSDMGFKTLPAATSSQIPLEDLQIARRRLDFSVRKVGNLLKENTPKDPSVKHEHSPPPDVETYYEKYIMPTLLEHLKDAALPRFYFSLHWSGEINIQDEKQSAKWGVVILVDSSIMELTQHHVMDYETRHQPKITIRVAKGCYEWASSRHRDRAEYPTPGASLGVDGDYNNSVSLGGYIVGDRTKKVYAMTVGHMCFDSPQPLNSSPTKEMGLNGLVQPSHQDFDGQLRVLTEDRDGLRAAGDVENAEEIDLMIKTWWKFRTKNGFAQPVFAVWNTISANPDEIPTVQDLSLSLVYEKRVGTNVLMPIPNRGIRAKSVRGTAPLTSNMVVYKIGCSTGYTECRLSTMTKSVFFDIRQNYRIQSHYVCPNVQDGYNHAAEMGDSGAWLIDGGGRVVGMIVSAAREDVGGTLVIRPLAQSIFMEIGKCLDLCANALGESVSILT
jgi:hypothetical protein